MSDDQVASVKQFVKNGGGLIATGETSLFNELGDQRKDYGLADLFGAHVIEPDKIMSEEIRIKNAGDTSHTYLRLTPELRGQIDGPKNGTEPQITGARHIVLNGFEETDILSFGGTLDSIKTDPGTEVVATFIPSFPMYPPEKSWMRTPKTDIPGLVLNTLSEGSRIAFLPADLDRQFGRYNLPDHGDLIENIVRWTAKEDIPLKVEGKGLLDCHLYKQANRLVLHIVNLTSAGTWRQPVDELIPIGPLKVSIKLQINVNFDILQLLVSKQVIKSTMNNGWCSFEIGSVLDHEVVVIG
jgi:hypothetical protein